MTVVRIIYTRVTDYNDIFYRNELGGIDSEDPKGREMIRLLKLYRPIHNLAWLVERLELLYDRIEDMEKRETDRERRQLLAKSKGKVSDGIYEKGASGFVRHIMG